MKKVAILFLFLCLSCQSNSILSRLSNPDNLLLYYAKMPCENSCTVYDLWIHGNGRVIFSGIANVEVEGKIKSVISKEDLQELKQLALADLKVCSDETSSLEKHNTHITFGKKKYRFCSEELDKNLKKLNATLETIAIKIQRNTSYDIYSP